MSPLDDGVEIKESAFLTIGKEYIALGISCSGLHRNVYLAYDDEEDFPCFFDIRQFQTMSNFILSNWIVKYNDKIDCLSFFPKVWLETPSFRDGFIDDQDPEMVALFIKERDFIYQEEPK